MISQMARYTPEQKQQAQADYESARTAYEERQRQATAVYARSAAGPKSDRDHAAAQIEAEYVAKVREAKGELAATTRRVHAQLSDFKITRDARLRAEDRKLDGLLAPFKQARNAEIAPLRLAKDAAWEKHRKAHFDEV